MLDRFLGGLGVNRHKVHSASLLGKMREIPEGGDDGSLSAIVLGKMKFELLTNFQYGNWKKKTKLEDILSRTLHFIYKKAKP